jgi:hypothetical protein
MKAELTKSEQAIAKATYEFYIRNGFTEERAWMNALTKLDQVRRMSKSLKFKH